MEFLITVQKTITFDKNIEINVLSEYINLSGEIEPSPDSQYIHKINTDQSGENSFAKSIGEYI